MKSKPCATVIINTVNEVPERLINAINSYKEQQGVDMHILVSTIEGDIAVPIAIGMGCEVTISETKGIYAQLNNAVNFIRGDWWSYASGNDIASRTKMIEEITRCTDYNKKICYSNFYSLNPDSGILQKLEFHEYNIIKHYMGNFVNDCATQHVSLIEKYGPFMWHLWENDSFYDYWLRVYEGEGNIFVWNPNYTWTYCVYGDSKHILRTKNPEELKKYADIRNRMLKTHLR
jgi:hypothetical protein